MDSQALSRAQKRANLLFYPIKINLLVLKTAYPCLCLWVGSEQITRTTRLRRTILQLRHIFFTDVLTFIVTLPSPLLAGKTHAAARQVRFF
jgi:hypothetical protein